MLTWQTSRHCITKNGISMVLDSQRIKRSTCIIDQTTYYYTTLYRPATALGFLISACNAAADASISRRLISRTACSTCKDQRSANMTPDSQPANALCILHSIRQADGALVDPLRAVPFRTHNKCLFHMNMSAMIQSPRPLRHSPLFVTDAPVISMSCFKAVSRGS